MQEGRERGKAPHPHCRQQHQLLDSATLVSKSVNTWLDNKEETQVLLVAKRKRKWSDYRGRDYDLNEQTKVEEECLNN